MTLQPGATYNVTVVKILPYGAVVEMEDKSTQLVHISNISDKFVRDVADFVSVGRQYKVDCIEGKVKPLELSMKKYTADTVLPYHYDRRRKEQ